MKRWGNMKSCGERDEKGRAGETDPLVSGNGKKPQQCSDAGKVCWLGAGRAGGQQRLPGVWIGWDEAQCGVWPPAKSPC